MKMPKYWSGVPQGLVLGLILFNIFIKSVEEGINSMIMKPTEDTKLECAPVEIIKMDADRFE